MDSKVWLLVEWLGESNIAYLYSVVDLESAAFRINNLQPGNIIFLHKEGKICQAKIVLSSENKKYVEDQMEILKRQDERVLSVCIKTISEVVKYKNPHNLPRVRNQSPITNVLDVENSSDSDEPLAQQQTRTRTQQQTRTRPQQQTRTRAQQQTRTPAILPEVLQVDSSSDSEINIDIEPNKRRKSSKSTPKHTQRHQQSNNSRRYVISSSPIPGTSAQENIILRTDQATQTEEPFVEVTITDMILLRESFKFIYKSYMDFVAYARSKGIVPRSRSERNNEVSIVELNNTDVPEVSESTVNAERRTTPRRPRVRRVSAQTTDNFDDDTVPIGNGHARIPTSVMRDIDWSSYDLATIQLLHAIFPRRVLATHSLVFRPSRKLPDEPEGKILDPKIIEDIVKTVAKKCLIPKSLVRYIIRLRCTDEAEIYRNRQKLRKELKRQRQQNEENILPSPSSDESASKYPPRKRNRRRSSS